ncbi:MAG: type III pantothenate kinase [Planctomycetota bacterium]|nr:type III pantothenate kinase [Planctomycetota bacterium]
MPRPVTHPKRTLAVAIGNTHLSFLAEQEGVYREHFPGLPLAKPRTWARAWKKLVTGMDGPPEATAIGSVVPDAVEPLYRWLGERGAGDLQRFGEAIPTRLKIVPEPAERVGEDRLAAALGALSLDERRPWVVVDCGTALTVNAVRPATGALVGIFEGGLILPGEALALRALHQGTAQLPAFTPLPAGTLGDAIGRSTASAIRSGVRRGQFAAVCLCAREQVRSLGPRTRLALTGGGAPYLWEPLRKELRGLRPIHVPDLVLRGLLAGMIARWHPTPPPRSRRAAR